MGRMGTGMRSPAHPSHGHAPKEGEIWVLSASPSVAGAEVSLGADVWGRAPSTVTHGMAKVPDSDCWTCPCWMNPSRQTRLQPAGPVGNAGSQGHAPTAAGSDTPPPALLSPAGMWLSMTRRCSSSARPWSSRFSRSSSGWSRRWVTTLPTTLGGNPAPLFGTLVAAPRQASGC